MGLDMKLNVLDLHSWEMSFLISEKYPKLNRFILSSFAKKQRQMLCHADVSAPHHYCQVLAQNCLTKE